MVNYENAKIYKLVCNKTGMIYVGSTCQRLLCKRLSGHVADYKRWKNGKYHYVTSFNIIENNDYYMELLEAVSCNSFDELAKKERYYIESIDCINKCIPGRTIQEWRQDNKEIIKDYKKQYHQDNKKVIKEYKKQYREENKEVIKIKQSVKIKCSKCGSVVVKRGLLRHQRSLKCQNTSDILLELEEIN